MSRLSVDNQFAINQTGNYFYSNPPPYAASSLYKEKTHIIFVIHLLLNNSCSTIHLTNLAAMKQFFIASILCTIADLLAPGISADAQFISTIAGTYYNPSSGLGAYSGDGGPAVSAELSLPSNIVLDTNGNLYIADAGNNRIRMINTAGIISTFAGNGAGAFSGDGGLAAAAALNAPEGIAIDDTGNLYIADAGNNRIRKVNTAGIITTVAGIGTFGYSGDGGAATLAKLNVPYGVSVDDSGNVYIADTYNHRIRKVNTLGIISTFAGTGVGGSTGNGGLATAARINSPVRVRAHDSSVYICDGNNTIRRVNAEGIINAYIGVGGGSFAGDGGAAISAHLNGSMDIAFDTSGNVYIADAYNRRIRKVDETGIINTIAGNGAFGYSGDGGLADTAEIAEPTGVIIDHNGYIYVADRATARIRKISPCNTSAGTITGSHTMCTASTMTLYDTTATFPGKWSSSDVSVASVDSVSGVVAALTSGTFAITCSVKGLCSPTPVTTTFTVSISNPGVYTVTGGGSYCSGGTGVNIGLNNSETGINYQLYRGDTLMGSPVPGTGAAINFGLQPAAGTYTVEATNTIAGCSSAMTDTAVVTILPLSHDSLAITPGPTDTLCGGTPVSFTAHPYGGGSAPTYSWYVNGSPAGATSSSYTYPPDNGDIVTCTMSSSIPCAVINPTYSVTMTVQPYGIPTVSIAASPAFVVCEGSPVTFMPSPYLGGYSPVYSWLVNDVVVGSGDSLVYDPANHDTVFCIMNSDFACRLSTSAISNKIVETVHPLLIPVVEVYASPSMVLSSGETATLTANVTNGGPDPLYQWYINETPVPGATNDVFVHSAFFNNDSVSCLVTNSGECAGIQAFNWVIINEYPAGVQQLGMGNDIRLLPNPNNGSFTIKGNWNIAGNEDAMVVITDVLGQVVYRNNALTQQGMMNEQVVLNKSLAEGMYLLKVNRGNEERVFRFVVE